MSRTEWFGQADVMQRESHTPRPSQKPALRLAALLLGAGTMHFVAPKFFDSTIPTQLPGEARTYTYVSGVAELAIGTALARLLRSAGSPEEEFRPDAEPSATR